MSESQSSAVSAGAVYMRCTCGTGLRVPPETAARIQAGDPAALCPHCRTVLTPDAVASAEARPLPHKGRSTSSEVPAATSPLHAIGWTVVVLGTVSLASALAMDTTVESGSSSFGDYGSFDRIHNMGLMGRQVVWALASGFAALCGAVFVVAAYLADLRSVGARLAHSRAPISPARES